MRAILAKSFIVAAVLAACGDNLAKPDGSLRHDAGNPDAPSFPPPPTLGALQLLSLQLSCTPSVVWQSVSSMQPQDPSVTSQQAFLMQTLG